MTVAIQNYYKISETTFFQRIRFYFHVEVMNACGGICHQLMVNVKCPENVILLPIMNKWCTLGGFVNQCIKCEAPYIIHVYKFNSLFLLYMYKAKTTISHCISKKDWTLYFTNIQFSVGICHLSLITDEPSFKNIKNISCTLQT